MMSRNILIGVGIVIIIAGIVIVAIMSGDTGIDVNDNLVSDSLGGTVKVGVLLPLTSILNEESKGALQATELSIADFNEHLESIDAQWRLEMVLEDTEANPSIAREKIELLYSQGINVMIGPATSAATAAVKEYADENDILVVSCCSSAHSLAIENDNILRIVPSDISQGGALVQVISEQDVDAIVPIWRDDVWGNDLVEFTRVMFEEKGIVVSDGIVYDPTSLNPSESVRLLADQVSDYVEEYDSTNTIVIFFGFDEVTEFVSTATNYDILSDVRWFGTTALTHNKDLVMDPITSKFASNVQFTTISLAESHNSIHNKLQKYILDNQIGVPSIFAYASYDVPKMIGEAMLEIDSLDTALLRDMIIERSSTFSGAMGTSELNAAGDLKTSDYEIWSIKDGQWVQVGQYMHGLDSVEMKTSDLNGEIPIGVLISLSGDFSSIGEETTSGIRLAVDDFNQYLAESGQDWTISPIIEDTQTNPVVALEKITSFNDKGTGIIIGPSTSAAVKNAKGYTDANNLIMISYSSTSPELALPNDSIYRTIPNDEKQGPAIANLMYDQGIRAAVIMYRADTWGDGLQDAITENFVSLGGIVGEPIRYAPTNHEFSVSVSFLADQVRTLVNQYGQDSVAVVLLGFAESLQIMQSAAQEDILDDVRWFGPDAITNDVQIINDPITNKFINATRFTTVQFATADNPITTNVRDHIMNDIGRNPSVYAYTAYDAIWLAGLSILESQSTDPTDIKSVIMSVARDRVGAAGPNELDDTGDLVAADYDIWNVSDNKWSVVGKYISEDNSITWDSSRYTALNGNIPVGVLVPLSGEISFLGEEANSGIRLAVDDFNQYLAESGQDWTISPIIEDTQTNPVVALEKTTSLNAKGIGVIVGPSTSASTKNVKGYADANNLVLISYSSSARSLAIPDDNIYRTVPDDGKLGPAIANTIRDQGIDAIVIIHRADAWGDDLNKSTSENFVSLGGIVGDPIRYPPKPQEFSVSVSVLAKQVQALVNEHGVDKVAVVLMGFIESLPIMQSAAQEDILDDVRWFGTNANTNVELITSDPIGREFTTTTRFTSFQLSPDNNPTTARVQDYVSSDIGRTPSVYAYTAYDAIWLAGLSILESQSTDPDAIKSVIMSVANDHIGAVGSTRLNAAGDLEASDHDIWIATDGEWSIIGKYLSSNGSVTWQ